MHYQYMRTVKLISLSACVWVRNKRHSSGPPVKCGYCSWLIQGCPNILQHKCLEHYDEHVECLKVDENIVTLVPRPGVTESPSTEEVDDENVLCDELLIEAVSKRVFSNQQHLGRHHYK
ncbi:uncharacterized protein LOC107218306 [Neodiprion lecontei]|uniref:Uncharacterized protein LOC107218306 n=1 Tax=Neodiprion lecontei TaxID=441921 RepID=A0ABM3GLS2_NEOLC|nr:uncharacterized protein LOC107218306 [Neodiprion lecontei]XP_046601181.1 uncharacterized protein LOC107218306 [Neodiprion lecontei]